MCDKIKECFRLAKNEEEKGKKHKGLLITEVSIENAKHYLDKARESIRFCKMYKDAGSTYRLPEEWFYSLYYCALAILCKFGVESRSQRCTALFLKYLIEKQIIEYNLEFIESIIVHKEKEKKSLVDEREEARYGANIKVQEIEERYDKMNEFCNEAISQAQDIVFSNKEFKVPEELLS